ncbi:hypothetical protein ACGFY6_18025 [Streptomyces sp. NPDC048387]|uniref:hypothetical protein n=1 Tax=Streptomyces sp. NPDC048387 TaxID=3365542 RepID=UPI003716F3E7
MRRRDHGRRLRRDPRYPARRPRTGCARGLGGLRQRFGQRLLALFVQLPHPCAQCRAVGHHPREGGPGEAGHRAALLQLREERAPQGGRRILVRLPAGHGAGQAGGELLVVVERHVLMWGSSS